ncbi:MAG: protein translocase subunit SecF [Proteobacteria bacterium]|nr:protein translocase subunit SecF [Pseudomonadota bacterium]MBQ4359058.1 protein translocase subunit SecF [Pseudomonadota bacterium]
MQFTMIKPHTNLPFMDVRKIAFVILSILIVIAIALTAAVGPQWGTSFQGGTSITLSFTKPVNPEKVRKEFVDDVRFESVSVQRVGSENENRYVVRTRTTTTLNCDKLAEVRTSLDAQINTATSGNLVIGQWPSCNKEIEDGIRGDFFVSLVPAEGKNAPDTKPEASALQTMFNTASLTALVSYEEGTGRYLVKPTGVQEEVMDLLRTKFADGFDLSKCSTPGDNAACLAEAVNASIDQIDTVGADVGEKFRTDSIVSILVALLLMLLYIAIRFDIRYAPSAVISLAVTVIITWGVVVALGIEITLETVAAFLSLVGYGINDTIVTFDRVRENVALSEPDVPLKSIVNRSINECLSRTIITSITTLIAIIPMAVLATGATKDFSVIMTIGICIATLDSIFVSCPMLLVFDQIIKNKQKRDQERREIAELNAQV